MSIGIDIGSTASKVVVLDDEAKVVKTLLTPSGWNSKETAEQIYRSLSEEGFSPKSHGIIATGYGRISVPYAQKTVTEITCHGLGASHLFGDEATVIDIGGQDTKIILLSRGKVKDFLMNDKCSAGTGKFLEVMANRLGFSLQEMLDAARKGTPAKISSMCTVFAESEVISLMGQGRSREDIAAGVVDSICHKVANLAGRKQTPASYVLTGGFSESDYVLERLGEILGREVTSHPMGRFAGALGAALLARKL